MTGSRSFFSSSTPFARDGLMRLAGFPARSRCRHRLQARLPPPARILSQPGFPLSTFPAPANEKGVDRTVDSRGFKKQNISLAKLPLYHWFADMPGGASVHTRLPVWHRLCIRAPTPRFRAAVPTCDSIYHRASHAALPGFPAPPHNRLQAPQSCRHCQPCACDVR